MKKILFFVLLVVVASCGKTNKTSDNSTSTEVNGNSNLETAQKLFEGTYDLLGTNTQFDRCAASIQIVRECDGLKMYSNSQGTEEFCHINLGDFDTSKTRDSKNIATTTLSNNILKSEIKIINNGPNPMSVTYSKTLSFSNEGMLVFDSNLKSQRSRCLYQKR
jgi:hypothetical protein